MVLNWTIEAVFEVTIVASWTRGLTSTLRALDGQGEVGVGPRGGGYSVWRRVPTAVQLVESGGCHDPLLLKKKGVLSLYHIVG